MHIEEAVEFFEAPDRASHRKLKTLTDVGLGYMTLGQAPTTLFGRRGASA